MTTETKRDSMDATVADVRVKLEETHIAPAKTQRRKLGLTDLPPSVRNKIYAHVLDTELVNVGKPNVSYTHSIKNGVLQFRASRHPFPVQTALFYVNKQISREAVEYFYSKNLFVRFEIYTADARHAKTMLEESGLLFSTSDPRTVEASTRHAMDLTIVEKNSAQKRATVMFPAQYLPRLINFMDQASNASKTWAPFHALFMTVLNTYNLETSRLQADLLELFRLLTNLGAVTIDATNLLPGYASGLQSSMTSPVFSADAWLAAVTDMADRAVEARENKDYATSAQHSHAAIIALTHGFLTRPEALHSQPEDFHKAVQRLRWRCALGLATTLYTAHLPLPPDSTPLSRAAATDLLAAETAAANALSLATDSPSPASNPWFRTLPPELIPPNKAVWFTDDERGMAWYASGLVHLALGEPLFAAGDLERAERLWREDGAAEGEERGARAEVVEAFERARGKIDWGVRPGSGLKRAVRIARGEHVKMD